MLRRCSRIGSAIIAGRVACVNRSQSGHWLYWLHGCPRIIIAKRPQQRSTHRDAWIVTTRTSVTKRIERWESQYSRKSWISLWRTKDLQNWQRRMGIEFRDRRAQKQQEALIEMHWYWGCMTCRDSWADWASFDEIDCPIYIQSIRPHRLSASNTHFTIIVKKYHCTDLQHHSPHDSQHSHHLKKTTHVITTKCGPNRGDWVHRCFHRHWQSLMCASWHCNPVFNRGLGLVLFELIELIQRINVSSPTEQHIVAAEHVCWVVHSLVYCASGARTMLCLLAMLRWRILGWRRLRETSFRRFESRLKWWQRGPREGRMNLTEYLGRDDRQVEQMIGVARLQFDSEHGRDVEWFYRRVYKLERVRYLGWCRPKDQQYQWKCQFPILGELRISRRSWKTRDSIGAAADVRGCWDCNRSSKNRSVHECEVYHGWRGMTMKGPPDRRKVQDGAGDENVKPKEKGDTSAKSIGNSSYPQTHFQGRCRHCGRKVTTCQTVGARNNVPSKISDGLSSSKGKSFKKESASCKWHRRFRKQSYNTSQYWTFLGLWDEKKCNEILLYTLEGKWDSKTAQMVERFKDTGHPVFKSISALSRGILIKEKQQRDHTLQRGCFKHRALVTDHSFCKSAQYSRSSFEMVWAVRLDKEKR